VEYSQHGKRLREKTAPGDGLQKGLAETGGDFSKSLDYLRQKGLATAVKRSRPGGLGGKDRGLYSRRRKIGCMVEVNSETDSWPRRTDFQAFARHRQHIAASNPSYIRREEITAEVLERGKRSTGPGRDAKKPEKVIDKIVEGSWRNFTGRPGFGAALREGPRPTIQDLLNGLIGKLGRDRNPAFTRYQSERDGQ